MCVCARTITGIVEAATEAGGPGHGGVGLIHLEGVQQSGFGPDGEGGVHRVVPVGAVGIVGGGSFSGGSGFGVMHGGMDVS
jgi:hypothetical protein